MYFGLDFPWWYSVGQLEVESRCRWITASNELSIGYAQINVRSWDTYLKNKGFGAYRHSKTIYLMAHAYINRYLYDKINCKYLFVMYQAYNGGLLINKECSSKTHCIYRKCYKRCNRKLVCIYRKHSNCIQYKSACKINYCYSILVYLKGKKYKEYQNNEIYLYWNPNDYDVTRNLMYYKKTICGLQIH